MQDLMNDLALVVHFRDHFMVGAIITAALLFAAYLIFD
jgi:hypothetical protein